jgi:hypothetical protein
MKHVALLVSASVLVSLSCFAQKSEEGMHAPDGGVIEQFNSILLPPVPHAPFSSTVTAEWTKVLEDGSTLTVQNHRLVVRDGAGRIYQERRRLVPKDSQEDPDLQRIEISDPLTHKKYFCRTATHVCALEDYSGPEAATTQPVGTQEDNFGTLTREDLGKTSVNGVEAVGTRETRTLNPGAIGNERVIAIVKEIWFAPQLGINVSVKRMDPRHGTQVINVTEISQGEPDPKLFQVPAGYTVVDRRLKPGERALMTPSGPKH